MTNQGLGYSFLGYIQVGGCTAQVLQLLNQASVHVVAVPMVHPAPALQVVAHRATTRQASPSEHLH